MGANAQTAVPAFTSGQVLTAAQVTQINTGIPVFATTVTRDAAFGGAGEKTLAQGQYAYIEATSTLQVYTGSAWITASSGLVCVRAETTFTTVSEILIDSVFTSTYTNYLIQINYTQTNSAGRLYAQFRTGGTTNTTSNYAEQNNAFGTALTAARIASGQPNIMLVGNFTITGLSGNLQINNPQVAEKSQILTNAVNDNGNLTFTGAGGFNLTTQFDGMRLSIDAGTFTGKYSIYGYSKTV
jgi:hypothetical protein